MDESEKSHSEHPADKDPKPERTEPGEHWSNLLLQITHSLNNHLTAIVANLSLAQTDLKIKGELQELLAESKAAALEASALTGELVSLTKDSEHPPDETELTSSKSSPGLRRILIVDDEKHIRMSLRKILIHLGYEADTASSSQESIDKIRTAGKTRKSFDAVILDLNLPDGQSGVDVFEQLKRLSPGLIGVITSGALNKSDMDEYRHLDFRGLLPKPFTIQDVEKTLLEAFDNS